ncbi:hypothetical protein KUV51_06350 [Tateyamaria omphalii]|uniref:hypothetical protein n=1 Tax=Tateyamaria omphalii TaxID=299262 RepID=UPI001C99DC39|nr:hypothetical protein [Tateyamaria omphalii]MBY5932615.1 hypothetical protein [Tateyamaria omphalii]
MKTIIAAGAVVVGMASAAVSHDALAYTFAECTGRFSAEMEHAWLMNDPGASDHETDRASFALLTSATMAPGEGRSILNHRIEVKLAHAALLQQASFGTTPKRAHSAQQVAQRHIAACRTLLLGS